MIEMHGAGVKIRNSEVTRNYSLLCVTLWTSWTFWILPESPKEIMWNTGMLMLKLILKKLCGLECGLVMGSSEWYKWIVGFHKYREFLVTWCSYFKKRCLVAHLIRSSVLGYKISDSPLYLRDTIIAIDGRCSNPLKTKCRLLYLKNQFVPHSKHFSSRL